MLGLVFFCLLLPSLGDIERSVRLIQICYSNRTSGRRGQTKSTTCRSRKCNFPEKQSAEKNGRRSRILICKDNLCLIKSALLALQRKGKIAAFVSTAADTPRLHDMHFFLFHMWGIQKFRPISHDPGNCPEIYF